MRCFYGSDCEDLIEKVIDRTPGAIERVDARLPAGFPQRVADAIFTALARSVDQLAGMPRQGLN